MYEPFEAQRPAFLARAVEDVIACCSPAGRWNGAKRSEQYWPRYFASGDPIAPKEAAQFLKDFQLARWMRWDNVDVAATLTAFRCRSMTEPVTAVVDLADALGRHAWNNATPRGSTPQTSAASKFATFLFPSQPMFIWDQLAMRSARLRDARRNDVQGRGLQLNKPYQRSGGGHDYAGFATACAAAQEEERRRPDFADALVRTSIALATVDGPMAALPGEFTERRLLDKLMFWEGYWLRAHWKASGFSSEAGPGNA